MDGRYNQSYNFRTVSDILLKERYFNRLYKLNSLDKLLALSCRSYVAQDYWSDPDGYFHEDYYLSSWLDNLKRRILRE